MSKMSKQESILMCTPEKKLEEKIIENKKL